MWTLESTGDLFGGRQIWLRPGTKHLFGRTKPPQGEGSPIERNHFIDNKSVSRKHIVIEVDNVPAGAATSLRSKSRITVKDTSKVGSKLDEEKFSGSARELSGNVHRIQLGLYDQTFIIKWQPLVLTFISYSKSLKIVSDPFKLMQERLEPLDVKVTREYVVGATTHVVSNKRNIASGLQALINGSYIVTDTFVDAMVEAAQVRADAADPDSDFLLDNDFSNLPEAMNYLPPPGREPVPRPAEYFRPNPARADIFSGYTFIFSNSAQFESLRDVVNTGGGKAFEFELKPKESTVQDFTTYVANVVGAKGFGHVREFKPGKGIVVVRNKNDDAWTVAWQKQVDAELGQESLLQNALLDIILTVDISALRKPLEIDVDVPSSLPAPLNSTHPIQSNVPQAAAPPQERQPLTQHAEVKTESQVRRRPPRKLVTKSRFTGFDDYKPEPHGHAAEPEEDSMIADFIPDVGAAESQAPSMSHDSQLADSRKRKSPPAESDKEDLVDALLPAAAAMKRRRLAEGIGTGSAARTLTRSTARDGSAGATSLFKKKRRETEVDVLESARERREAEEEAARRDAEALHDAMEGMDIDAIKLLVRVEEMVIAPRAAKATAGEMQGARWDERWNGRKNFKRFRKVGREVPVRGSKIIVPLEEAAKGGRRGMGAEYFFDGPRTAPSAGSTFERTQEGGRRSATPSRMGESEAPQQERAEELLDLTFDDEEGGYQEQPVSPPPVSETQRSTRSRRTGTQNSKSQASSTGTVGRGTKRSAEGGRAAPPAKRTRGAATVRARSPDESESEDDLRFQFRKRR